MRSLVICLMTLSALLLWDLSDASAGCHRYSSSTGSRSSSGNRSALSGGGSNSSNLNTEGSIQTDSFGRLYRTERREVLVIDADVYQALESGLTLEEAKGGKKQGGKAPSLDKPSTDVAPAGSSALTDCDIKDIRSLLIRVNEQLDARQKSDAKPILNPGATVLSQDDLKKIVDAVTEKLSDKLSHRISEEVKGLVNPEALKSAGKK